MLDCLDNHFNFVNPIKSRKVKMVSFTSLLVAVSAISGVFAAPNVAVAKRSPGALSERGGTPSATGTHNGFYFSWWTDNGAQATYTNGPAGQYSITWSGNGNLVGGKGWMPGTSNRYACLSMRRKAAKLTAR